MPTAADSFDPPRPGSLWISDEGLSFTIRAVTADADGLHVITIVPTLGASDAVEFDLASWQHFVVANRLRESPAGD
jgi:hypothetical protein